MPLLYANLLGVPIQGGLRGVDVILIWFGLSAMYGGGGTAAGRHALQPC